MNTRPKYFYPSILLNIVLLFVLIISYYSLLASSNQEWTLFFKKYHERKKDHFETLPNDKNEIIFLGNSITDGGNWSELLGNMAIKNRGINSDKTTDVLNRINEVCESKPSKIFILIGTNDLAINRTVDEIFQTYEKILSEISLQSPATKIYIQSVLPVNVSKGESRRKNEDIRKLNTKLEASASKFNATYINLFDKMLKNNQLDPEYTNDGLHLLGKGYLKWKEIIIPYLEKENVKN